MSRNLHLLYYKEYFKGLDFSFLTEEKKEAPESVKQATKEKNDALCKAGQLQPIPCPIGTTHTLQFKVLYPGLVTGVGIGHEAKIEGEFKLGMHFDWTYGMPVIYGSSVKGMLRAYFKDIFNPQTEKEEETDKFKVDIFGEDNKDKKKGYKNEKSIYDRDIFFDAVILKPDKKGRILCTDSITSHLKGPLKNPNPITFMKIAPGCTIEFRFKLVDSKIKFKDSDKTLVMKAEEKLEIFKTILETVGIGAKTNVGYGQLKAIK